MTTRLRKGMLIRKKLPSSIIPIGPWMIIRSVGPKIKAERVDPDYIMRKTEDICELDRNMVYIPTKVAIVISSSVIYDISIGRQWVVAGPASKKWMKVYDEHPEIITFSATNGNKVIVKVDCISMQTKGREKWIKVYIDSIITKCIWS